MVPETIAANNFDLLLIYGNQLSSGCEPLPCCEGTAKQQLDRNPHQYDQRLTDQLQL